MSPIFVALGGIRFLGERPERRTWIGMGLTMLGAIALGLADASDLSLGLAPWEATPWRSRPRWPSPDTC